jgi:hypothetical protein
MHIVNPIEMTNLDTIDGSPTIPWSRPRDLLGSTISCVNGGNFGNTRSTAAWLGRARDGLYGRDVATCAGGQIPNGRALDGPLGLRPYFRVVVLALAGRAPWECAARRAQRRGYDQVW